MLVYSDTVYGVRVFFSYNSEEAWDEEGREVWAFWMLLCMAASMGEDSDHGRLSKKF